MKRLIKMIRGWMRDEQCDFICSRGYCCQKRRFHFGKHTDSLGREWSGYSWRKA